jgi:hypothetical protein
MNFDRTNVSIPFNMTIKSNSKLPPIDEDKQLPQINKNKLPTALSRALDLKKWK